MRIPKRVKISGQWFSVKRTDLPDSNGLMEPQSREIHLAKKMPPGALGMIFLHELIHAIIEVTRPRFVKGEEDEEELVTWASHNIWAMIIDNHIDFLGNGERRAIAQRRKRSAKKKKGYSSRGKGSRKS